MAPTRNSASTASSEDNFTPFVLEELFPPQGSEAALMRTAEFYATETLSSIYFDLNTYSRFQQDADPEDFHSMQVMDNLVGMTVTFMDEEFSKYTKSKRVEQKQGESKYLAAGNRFYATVSEIGWKMTAICAHTEAFRRTFREADYRLWGCLLGKIQENALSIEYYAHCRALDWTSLIKNVTGPMPGLPSIQEAVASALDWDTDHPHHTFLTLDGNLKHPKFKGEYQTNIDSSIVGDDFSEDPTVKSEATSLEGCHMCGSYDACGCTLQSRAADLVELVEYPEKGTGVRTLTSFRRNDILDVFVGELRADTRHDNVYPLTQDCDGTHGPTLCYICSEKSGNWTRFINHSCQPSTQFMVRTIGDRVVTTVEAIRSIMPFEELTIDYGPDYWSGADRSCACGHWNCFSNPSSESGSPLPRSKVLGGKVTKGKKAAKGKKAGKKASKTKTKSKKGAKAKK